MEGIRAHKILQSQMGDGYRKEFYLKSEFIFKDIMFFIEGRADGILTQDDEVTIDEIKSTYTDLGLIDEEYRTANMAQAKCYAYMYGLMYDLSKLSVQVRYYNLDTKETKTIKQAFGLEELKTFLRSFETYLDWAETIISLGKERDRTIEEAAFPFKDYGRVKGSFRWQFTGPSRQEKLLPRLPREWKDGVCLVSCNKILAWKKFKDILPDGQVHDKDHSIQHGENNA